MVAVCYPPLCRRPLQPSPPSTRHLHSLFHLKLQPVCYSRCQQLWMLACGTFRSFLLFHGPCFCRLLEWLSEVNGSSLSHRTKTLRCVLLKNPTDCRPN